MQSVIGLLVLVGVVAIYAKLVRIERRLRRVEQAEEHQMADLTALATEVEENGDAIDSAVSLLGTLAQEIRDNATDPAALAALADELDAQTNALAAAVVANTPAAPTEPEVEQPDTP